MRGAAILLAIAAGCSAPHRTAPPPMPAMAERLAPRPYVPGPDKPPIWFSVTNGQRFYISRDMLNWQDYCVSVPTGATVRVEFPTTGNGRSLFIWTK